MPIEELLLLLACVCAVLIGANDGGNIFGLFIESRLVPEKNARFVCAVFSAAGAYLLGAKGTTYISSLAVPFTSEEICLTVFVSCAVMLVFTLFGMPVSSSHCLYFSILGTALKRGVTADIGITAVPLTIIAVPLFAFLAAAVFSGRTKDGGVRPLTAYLCVAAGGFALGANNIAIAAGLCNPEERCILPLFLSIGIYYFSGRVSDTIGRKIVRLNKAQAINAQLSCFAVTLIFAVIGIPTSSSHAIVGATAGGGLLSGRMPSGRTLAKIAASWVLSPAVSLIIAYITA